MTGLPPLQNNQDRWAQFFQGQGRAMPQVNRMPVPQAQGAPQGLPQMGQPIPMAPQAQGRIPQQTLDRIMAGNGLAGGIFRAMRPQGSQGFPRNEQMVPVQSQAQQPRRGGFFSRRSAY